MRNKIIIILISVFFFSPLSAENLNIQALNISFDKKSKITIFQNQVSATDNKNNQLFTEQAEYDKGLQLFKSKGKTKILTSGGYEVNGENIVFDNTKKIIKI